MAPPLSNLELALVSLSRMDSMELQALHAISTARIEKLVPVDHKCNFMSLSAELRNRIYTIYGRDLIRNRIREEPTSNALALVSKQISAEYLSLLNSNEMLSATCLISLKPVRWAALNAREMLSTKGKYYRFGKDVTMVLRDSFDIHLDQCYSQGFDGSKDSSVSEAQKDSGTRIYGYYFCKGILVFGAGHFT